MTGDDFGGYRKAGLSSRAIIVRMIKGVLPQAATSSKWYAVYPNGIVLACRNKHTAAMLTQTVNGGRTYVFDWNDGAVIFLLKDMEAYEGRAALSEALRLVWEERKGRAKMYVPEVANMLKLLPRHWEGRVCCVLVESIKDETVLRFWQEGDLDGDVELTIVPLEATVH